MSLLLKKFTLFGGPSGPLVSANTNGVTNDTADNPVIAGVAFNTNGTEKGSTGAGAYTVDRGSWLDSGSSSEVWIERTLNAGTLTHADPGTGRLQLSSARTYAVHDATIPGGPVTCNVTFDFYDAASGGNLLDSVTYTLSANRST